MTDQNPIRGLVTAHRNHSGPVWQQVDRGIIRPRTRSEEGGLPVQPNPVPLRHGRRHDKRRFRRSGSWRDGQLRFQYDRQSINRDKPEAEVTPYPAETPPVVDQNPLAVQAATDRSKEVTRKQLAGRRIVFARSTAHVNVFGDDAAKRRRGRTGNHRIGLRPRRDRQHAQQEQCSQRHKSRSAKAVHPGPS